MSVDLMSPFAGLTWADGDANAGAPPRVHEVRSPFDMGTATGEAEVAGEGARDLLAQLADEDFADALEALVDEAARRHLDESGSWSVAPTATEAYETAARWIEPLASASERAVDRLAEQLAPLDLSTASEGELGEALASVQPEQLGAPEFDNFSFGWLGKIKNAVTGAVKTGLRLAGKLIPVGLLLDRLKRLVRPLLERLLKLALDRLPEAVRPAARALAAKLGIGSGERGATDPVTQLAEDLDLEIVDTVHGGEAAPGGTASGYERQDHPAAVAPVLSELDAARERLAEQLADSPPGVAPTTEIEQFLPVVMAARPLLKLAVSAIGRDRILKLFADGIAALAGTMIGADAARTIARPLADAGMRMIGMEVAPAQAESTAQLLAAEAMASTVEGTIHRLLDLPAGSFEDELQVDAAVQQAFAASAAAAMPDRVLRADLPERETAQEGGVWVLMPRGARPAYRYRRYSRVYAVPVTRRLAALVPWSDGASLESHLLDAGTRQWPVAAEVSLFEALPGTHFGHLGPDASEVQPLTPEVAGLLLGEPGLGRAQPAGWTGRSPAPGARYFHVRAGNVRGTSRRPRRRVLVHLDLAAPTPTVRVVLRLSERKAQQVLARLDTAPRDLPAVLVMLQHHYTGSLPGLVARRLVASGVVTDASRAAAVGTRYAAAVGAALSAYLTERAGQFAAAVRDPADGVTVSIAFTGVSAATVEAAPPAGSVTVHPGWRRHG